MPPAPAVRTRFCADIGVSVNVPPRRRPRPVRGVTRSRGGDDGTVGARRDDGAVRAVEQIPAERRRLHPDVLGGRDRLPAASWTV